jgi:LysR family transcriptional regulator, nod-box dependent transcriptional activator
MPSVDNLRQINLNSLPVLREILRHGSISKAAEVLHLTAPALSNTLRQLRGYFDDELIVRQGRIMRLTPKAEAMLQPLEFALSSVQDMLQNSSFDSLSSTEQFQIAMTDHSMEMLAAPLTAIMTDEAPHMVARFMGFYSTVMADFASGKINMMVMPRAVLSSGRFDANQLARLRSQHLWSEPLVCIGHIDDSRLTAGLSIDEYLQRPHAGYYLNSDQHVSVEQSYLTSFGYKQHDRLLISNYLPLPLVVATTGCLSLVPLSLAVRAAQVHPIQFVVPPIAFPEFELIMVWHERDDAKPSFKWLRETLRRCVANPGPSDILMTDEIAIAA